MKKSILALALSLPLFAFGQDQPREYDAHKLVKQKAENSCTVLANITLHSTDYRAIAIHTEPKTKGVIFPDREGYHIVTVYPYRADGVSFFCAFRDYRNNGLIQLVEYGLMGGGEDVTNIVKPLW